MQQQLEVIRFSQLTADGSAPRPSNGDSSTGTVLNQRCLASDRPLLAVGETAEPIDPSSLGDARRELLEAAFVAVLAPLCGYEWVCDLAGIPWDVALRVPFVERGVLLVFRREDWQRCGGFPESARPLGGFACRLAALGPLHIASSGTSARPAIEFEPPPLSPAPLTPPADVADFDPRHSAGVTSAPDAIAVGAGLWQLHGGLEESHRAAQSIEGLGQRRAGDYWHAIMHRRERDFGNAKYWFRHVGRHPLMDELSRRAGQILDAAADAGGRWRTRLGAPHRWDPGAFVDLCEAASAEPGSALERAARRIQWHEMILLLGATCRDAYSECDPRGRV